MKKVDRHGRHWHSDIHKTGDMSIAIPINNELRAFAFLYSTPVCNPGCI